MNIEDVLKLLEQRSKEHRDTANSKTATTPEARIAVQVDTAIADELDRVIAQIRAKLSRRDAAAR